MKKYVCEPCGYVYDPEVGDPDNGIAPGTAFEDLPEDWVCPICGMGKDAFAEEQHLIFVHGDKREEADRRGIPVGFEYEKKFLRKGVYLVTSINIPNNCEDYLLEM